MRFTLKDYAVVAFVVSLYLATATAIGNTPGAWIGAAISMLTGVGVLIDVSATLLAMAYAGPVILRLDNKPPSRVHHLLIALVANGFAMGCVTYGDPILVAFAASMLTLAVIIHLAFAFGGNDTIVFHENLVVAGANLCSWKRCHFRLSVEPDRTWLEVKTPWYSGNLRCHLPKEHVNDVRQVLAVKQGPEKGTTDEHR